MPELPEVETVRRTLAAALTGAVIRRVSVRARDVIGRPDPETFAVELAGATFAAWGRRGKYLLLRLEPGPQVLVVHLRMTGRLLLADRTEPEPPHTHVVFDLEDGRVLRFADVRRFGRLYLFAGGELPARIAEAAGVVDAVTGTVADAPPTGARPADAPRADAPPADAQPTDPSPPAGAPPGLFTLGPEPLSRGFSGRWLAGRCLGRRAPIKAVLLDQRVVAGLGNIYVDEALFRAGIHPARAAGDLRPEDFRRLVRAVRAVLRLAVKRRGTTLSDYVDGRGRPGQMRAHLAVYGRAGEPCRRCGGPVSRTRVAGRGTHFCPRCQPAAGD
ncbi:MAG TPA: Fpg/Nei family DNA glycosylase [Bacillota bacterium]